MPFLDELRHAQDGSGGVSRPKRVGELEHQVAGRRPEQPRGVLYRHRPARSQLVQRRQRIPNPALGRARDQLQRAFVGVDPFFLRDAREVFGDRCRGDTAEVEPLAPRQDRRQHAVRLGRREDEDHVLGRLLDGLQEGVPALSRHHVRFVDDVDLLARDRGRQKRVLPELADVVHAPVRRRVDLDHVERGSFGDRHAGVAHVARVRGGAQLSAFARMRAVDVFPVPREPLNR